MTAILSACDIVKHYGTVHANDGVSLTVCAGEIHALIGENGAGKSTLVNILYGATAADSGTLHWQGDRISIKNPSHARALGIGVVFQKFSLFEPLTVQENILLAIDLPPDKLHDELQHLSERYGLRVEANRRVDTLSAGEKQRVEIVRCLLQKPSLLIMDEPTSVLTPAEVEQLFVLLRTLAAGGCAILFISHKLKEVESLCERVTVLRRGKTVAQSALAGISRDALIELMVGDVIDSGGGLRDNRAETAAAAAAVMQLSDIDISLPSMSLTIDNLQLKSGCITGVAGIAGNGQEQLIQCISGELTVNDSNITLAGELIGDWQVAARAAAGVLSVPTDRYHTAAVGGLSLADNILLGCMDYTQYSRHGFLRGKKIQQFAEHIISSYNVAAPVAQTPAQVLSGGNLQKFIIGRAVLQQPRVLAVANPTWGVDVQSALFIRRALCEMAEQGGAVLVVSEDLDELFEVADEIAVISNGKVSAPLPVTASLSAADIGAQLAQV